MSVTHPDIQDFITCKDLEREEAEGDISTFNISVLVSDTFMEAAKKTRASGVQQNVPRNVLQDVAEHAWQTGEPGLIFIDRINAFNPMRGALGDIKATNPCFPADVRIATQRGLLTLGELYKTQEELVVASDRRVLTDGLGVTPRAAVPVFKTSEAEKVYRVTTKHGFEVRATANHKFLTPDGWKELAELSTGDTLFVQSAEGMWSDHYAFTHEVLSAHAELLATAGSNNRGDVTSRTGRKDVREKFGGMPERWSRDLGAFLGFMVGDGFVSEDKAGITFSESDYEELKDTIAQYKAWFGGSVQHHASCSQIRFGKVVIRYLAALGLGSEKAINKRVPESIFSAPREAVVGFLQGLFTADGTVNLSCSKKSCSIRLASSSETLLKDVQLLLSNFGLVSRLYQRREAGVRAMPDGKGGTQLYPHASQYELMLDKINRDLFAHKIGFLTRSKQQRVLDFIASKQRPSNTEPFETVVTEIVFEGIESVYDTTEPVAHSVVANGIVAHQCGEIPLFPGEPCDLGAINLAQYVETPDQGLSGFDWASFKDDTKTCIRFLDNVLDVNRFALEDNRSMSMKLRRLGLGIMGLMLDGGERSSECDGSCGRDVQLRPVPSVVMFHQQGGAVLCWSPVAARTPGEPGASSTQDQPPPDMPPQRCCKRTFLDGLAASAPSASSRCAAPPKAGGAPAPSSPPMRTGLTVSTVKPAPARFWAALTAACTWHSALMCDTCFVTRQPEAGGWQHHKHDSATSHRFS